MARVSSFPFGSLRRQFKFPNRSFPLAVLPAIVSSGLAGMSRSESLQ